MATAPLPPLLPTPPRSKMVPLLPTPCLIILPASFGPPSSSPGRADSVERWDANKKPCGPVSSSSGSPGRASACDRWDSSKIMKTARGTSSASERRQDGSKSPGRASSSERWDLHKRPLSRTSSAERWDMHKKPRPQATDGLDDGSSKSNVMGRTGEKEQEITDRLQIEEARKVATAARTETAKLEPIFSGASFFATPEPSMLPIPSLLLAR